MIVANQGSMYCPSYVWQSIPVIVASTSIVGFQLIVDSVSEVAQQVASTQRFTPDTIYNKYFELIDVSVPIKDDCQVNSEQIFWGSKGSVNHFPQLA